MDGLNKFLGALVGLTVLALLLRGGGRSADTVISSFAKFNRETFGTFLNAA